MAKDPAFLFYPNDWVGGTMGMSFEDKGAYIEVLMMQFNRGHMTEDMIIRMIGQLWVNIKHKFKQDDAGSWYNERLEIEKEKRKNYVQSRFNNKNGTNQYPKKNGHMSKHMDNVNVNIKKGGMGENIVGVRFTEDNSQVVFPDGSKRKLTASEKTRLIHNDLTPEQIIA